MKVLIIGGVAAGPKTAAKLKRELPDAEVTLLVKGRQISYAGCGLPYYIGGVIEKEESLIVKTPRQFAELTGVKVLNGMEAVCLYPERKEVVVQCVDNGERRTFFYDKLVVATGADPFVPPLPGRELAGVYTLRTLEDAVAIRAMLDAGDVKRAVVVGGGFIGLEVAENLAERGIKTTIVEMAQQIMPGFDKEMAYIGEDYLMRQNVMTLCDEKVVAIEGDKKAAKVITDRRKIKADLVILSIGVKPNSDLAQKAGLELGARGAIAVDERMKTSNEHIYAVGDCAEVKNLMTGKADWIPLGSTANKAGRVAALNLAAVDDILPGVLGTAIVKLFGWQAARTGLSEAAARAAGYDVISVIVPANDHAHYYPDAKEVITKLIADRATRRLLGAQVAGMGAVDKPIDILAAALSFGAKVEDLERLDLAYAPPFSMAMASTIVAANVLRNKLEGRVETITPSEFWQNRDAYVLVNVRPAAAYAEGHLESAVSLPVESINAESAKCIRSEKTALLICKIGKNSYLAYKKLQALGYRNCKILEGGMAVPQKIYNIEVLEN